MVSASRAAVVLVSSFSYGFGSTWVHGLDDTSVLMQRDAMHGKTSVEVENSIHRIDRAMNDLKGGVERLVSGTPDELSEASSDYAAQLAKRIDVSLIEEDASPAIKPISQSVSELKEKVGERMNKVVTGINKGVSSINTRVERNVGNMMSKANSAVDDIHSAASNALQGMKDFTDAASEPITKKLNSHSTMLNSKVKLMITKINRAIDDMKGGMHDLAHGLTDGMKEASEKIAAQLAQSVHEHVRQEIELARAAEPASLLEVQASHNEGSVMSKARSAVDTIHTAATRALDGMREVMDEVGETLLRRDTNMGSQVGDMISRTNTAIGEMKTSVHDFSHAMSDSLQEASKKIAIELTRTVDEHVQQELALAKAQQP